MGCGVSKPQQPLGEPTTSYQPATKVVSNVEIQTSVDNRTIENLSANDLHTALCGKGQPNGTNSVQIVPVLSVDQSVDGPRSTRVSQTSVQSDLASPDGKPAQSKNIDKHIHRRRRNSVAMKVVTDEDVSNALEKARGARTSGHDKADQLIRRVSLNALEVENGKEVINRTPVQSLMNNLMVQAFEDVRNILAAEGGPPDKVQLPRGGTYVKTSAGAVQIGLPPETIKDCMALKLDLPTHYVIPKERFDRQAGLNIAEFEFPAYFNFFIKRSRVNIVCQAEEEATIRTVFQETLFGPVEPNGLMHKESCSAAGALMVPDLEKELNYFRMNPFNPKERMQIDTLINFIHFDAKGVARFSPEGKGVEVTVTENLDHYVVAERDLESGVEKEIAKVSDIIDLPSSAKDSAALGFNFTDFSPPLFGCTFLGTSHGFDPGGTTTGFVLWMNGRGIMVDPPPHSGSILKSEGIPAKLIDAIVLTHCHADHDAGTFQKILEESRVMVITTPTIGGSFIRKYSALVGLEEALIKRLFTFQPVTVDEPMKVHGGEIRFFYSLHAIPCCGFEASFGGKKIIYSGDTCYIPERIQTMYEGGTISEHRRDQLLNFNWGADLILHEAGVPPLHTPLTELAKLDPDVKRRLYCVHVGLNNFPFDEGLKIASCGIENTIRVEVSQDAYRQELELVDMIGSLDIFRNLPIIKAREILQSFKHVSYKRGENIIEEGSHGSQFFVIESGACEVTSNSNSVHKIFTMGDYFGEMSLMTGKARWATVSAFTDVKCLVFEKGDFYRIILNTEVHHRMLHVALMRMEPSWKVIAQNKLFSHMTECQKTELLSVMKRTTYPKGEKVWVAGEPGRVAVLVCSGELAFEGQSLNPFTTGAFLGEVDCLLDPHSGVYGEQHDAVYGNVVKLHETTLEVLQDAEVYLISKEDITSFLLYNPGILVNALNTYFIE